MRSIVPASILAALALLAAGPARARDTWTTPHPGVRLLERVTDRPWRVYATKIDLCARGVKVRATAAAEKRRTVSSFADRVDAEVAVNADFFSYDTYNPTGLAMSGGEVWHADMAGSGDFFFGEDRAFLNAPSRALTEPPFWAREAVGGRPLLVDDGEVLPEFNRADCSARHPRTAIGYSEDRRTLILMVVDGRSNASIGMNCAEVATTMHGLGAWRAMNLDGGGSSTMWVRGEGVMNDPSDGAQRTVSNHLGVHADGVGVPGNCDFSLAEVIDQAGVLSSPGGTDVNGDGRADVCARASAGFRCVPAREEGGFEGLWEIPGTSDDDGFDAASRFATFRTGDLNGDGRDDVCARGAAGVLCWLAGQAGFVPPFEGPRWSDETGWAKPAYYSTLRLADLDGDGRADLCARAAAGLRCHLADDTGLVDAPLEGPAWSDASGFGQSDHYGTLRFADYTGDGRADVCIRAASGMRCAASIDGGFAAPIDGPAWSDAAGFADVSKWSTIRFEDVDGDGLADLCARTAAGVECARSTGEGFAAPFAGPTLSDASGWADHDNYGTMRFGDVDGDGDRDLCARGNDQFYCWLYANEAFGERIVGPGMSDARGWGDFIYNTSIRLADVTGDGRADICARSSTGVRCWHAQGAAFSDAVVGPNWSDESGWALQRYYTTLRIGDAPARVRPEPPPVPLPDAAVPLPDAALLDAALPDAAVPPGEGDASEGVLDALTPAQDAGGPGRDGDVGVEVESPRDAGTLAPGQPATPDAAPPALSADRGLVGTGACGVSPAQSPRGAVWVVLLAALWTLCRRVRTGPRRTHAT